MPNMNSQNKPYEYCWRLCERPPFETKRPTPLESPPNYFINIYPSKEVLPLGKPHDWCINDGFARGVPFVP